MQIRDPLRFGLIAGSFPWPVRRIEVQAEEERLLGRGIVLDYRHSALAQQIGQVSRLVNLRVVIPKVVAIGVRRAGLVSEVIQRAGPKAPEVIVSTFQRAVIREKTKMPFADQRGAV